VRGGGGEGGGGGGGRGGGWGGGGGGGRGGGDALEELSSHPWRYLDTIFTSRSKLRVLAYVGLVSATTCFGSRHLRILDFY